MRLAFGLYLIVTAGAGLAPAAAAPGTPFDLQGFLDKKLAAGAKTVTVPPGRYRVTPRNREHLALRNLAGITIIADGVEMICTETTRALTIEGCTNLTLRGLSIDYDPLPFTQGRITALSPDKSVHEIELFEGYPTAESVRNFKYEIFARESRTLRCGDHGIKSIETLDPRHIRITTTGGRADDPEQVGDVIAIGSEYAPHGSIPHAVECSGNKNVRLEGITLWASNCFGFLEVNCDGSTYSRCRIDRRPADSDPVKRADPRIRSLDADAFHSKHAVKGPAYIECSARFMGDDGVNICGDYHLVMGCQGRVLRVFSKSGKNINIAAGDPVELLSYTGERLPDAKVVAIEPDAPATDAEKAFFPKQGMDAGLKARLPDATVFRVTLDREVELPMGSAICSTLRTGNGFVVRGCDFSFNRSRGILIKASDGVVEGNTLVGNWGHAIQVSPEWWWLESGSSNNVRVLNNKIRDCKDIALAVYAFGGAPGVAPAGAHNNITVSGNRIAGCPLPNVLVTSTRGLALAGNACTEPSPAGVYPWVLYRFGLQGKPLEPVMTINCEPAKPAFTYQNPLPFTYPALGEERSEVRDPCIIGEGGTYYLVFTMWPFRGRDEKHLADPDNGSSPGIALYSSPDLKAWKFENWLVKSSELPDDSPYKHRFWAPEIHKIGGKYYLIFTADNWLKNEYNPAGRWGSAGYAFVGVADKITGPYRHITYIPGGPCDTSLFGDADGQVYAVMPKYNIFVQKLDLSRLEEGTVRLVGEEKLAVACKSDDIPFKVSPEYLEGPWMEKMGGKYVLLYAALFRDKRAPGYWVGAAYADSPLGPWTKDPRGQVFEGGHVALFDGPDGRKWVSYRVEHTNSSRGRLAIDPVLLDSAGKVQVDGPSETPRSVPAAAP